MDLLPLLSVLTYIVLGPLIRALLTNALASRPQDSPFPLQPLARRDKPVPQVQMEIPILYPKP